MEKLTNRRIEIKNGENKGYTIVIESSFKNFLKEIEQLQLTARKICIVADTNTEKYYVDELKNNLSARYDEVITFSFKAGESSKNLNTVQNLYEVLIKNKFERTDCLLALGGGVVGDLTGYTAATYLRGIDFIQIPTSLLAMVDSSIGGKTGVDFRCYKNMVGAFYQPKLVYMNIKCLDTLPRREYCSGIAEVIKYGLIEDFSFYKWLIEKKVELLNYNTEDILTMLEVSCHAKKKIVEIDPKEKGIRAILNLGHTIGHAIEKLKDFQLLHGECVAIGTVAACYLSYKKGLLTKNELEQIEHLLVQYELPIRVDGVVTKEILDATKNDKKMCEGKIKFVLIDGVGHGIIDNSITDYQLIEAIEYVLDK